jgi:Mn-dependent DtxR family transcriptional regulator
MAEFEEREGSGAAVALRELLARRSWTPIGLRHVIHRAVRAGTLRPIISGTVTLTAAGREAAFRVLRNHRLWEMYLIRYADVAPSHVDRDADEIEHVLSSRVITELERAIAGERRIPPSPHAEVTAG